ncbi:MAG TPA: hypothetical protein DCP53_02000 [Elusimicrobia bacterium]|nr:hypothetical protein [Elusimicrobiota bacterium]
MKKIISFIMLFGFACLINASTISDKSGTTGFTFLKIAQGARATAMGECYVGLADDVNAIYFNPAGLSQTTMHEVSASYVIWFEDISKSYVGYVHPPFNFGTVGLSINYIAIPFEKRTIEDDNNYSKVTLANYVISAAYGKKISEKISAGAVIKIISEDLDTKTNSGFAVDLGGLYKMKETFNLGLSLQNIGGNDTPMNLRLGVLKNLMDKKLSLLSDLYYGLADGTMSLGLGGEYKLNDYFCPRLGYRARFNNSNLTGLAGFTAGFGLKYQKYNLDYVLAPYGELGTTHRLDFIIKF